MTYRASSIALLILLILTTAACGSAKIGDDGGEAGNTGDAAIPEGGSAGEAGAAGGAGSSGNAGDMNMGGATAGEDPSSGNGDACEEAGLSCGSGQRCEADGATASCVDNTCAELDCGAGEDCRAAESGSGYVCIAAGCVSHADCGPAEHCEDGACRLDICEALERTCDGDEVRSCDAVGSGEAGLFTCGSGGYFSSSCTADSEGQATCDCEGDWDCPADTVCEVGLCVGTGVAPTCTLPPVDFASVPPALEVHWGGDEPGDSAHDGTLPSELSPAAPFPDFPHVLNTPVVANLDDDNGDGLINELDFPEILFTSHRGDNPWSNGLVRAIHGGGPRKGADYFARCGDLLWTEDAPIADACTNSAPTADSGAPLAVGDLNGDGVPEIVVPRENNTFEILNNRGESLYQLQTAWNPGDDGETIAIANLDHSGYAEIIVGPHVYMLGDDASGALIVTHILSGSPSLGRNSGMGFMSCPADLDPSRAGLEVAAGTTLYALPANIDACDTPPCSGALDVVWNAPDVGSQDVQLNSSDGTHDGYCAVSDVWGADHEVAPGPNNPPDGLPEVVLIANGRLIILEGTSGKLISIRHLNGGDRGGAPNVDDFDGDGFMEVASALQNFYVMVDLQEPDGTYCPAWDITVPRNVNGENTNPTRAPGDGTDGMGSCETDADCQADVAVCGLAGTCVCLHNGWRRGSDDNSSRATSSSVFDFNGDGSAEVIYNDECELRVYRGLDGSVLYNESSRSRTGIENPVVADVDNDGNAEIVVGSNNAVNDRCNDDGNMPTGVNGLRVFGDPTDTWVAARRIWNQQSYHVTHVTEAGGIPTHEAESWIPLNGRLYNTYRSQPRSYGVAPDLSVTSISAAARAGGCGTGTIGEFETDDSSIAQLTVEVRNLGDLRVGPGVLIDLVGVWDTEGLTEALHADDSGTPLTIAIENSLEPGASVILSVDYDVRNNTPGRLPDSLEVTVDSAQAERECNEDNNTLSYTPTEEELSDLQLTIAGVVDCPDATVSAEIENSGATTDADITITWYAGNPYQGGMKLGESTVAGGLEGGESKEVTALLAEFPVRGDVLVFGVVDEERATDDCNRANNTTSAPETHSCMLTLE